jgi:hypothetical protein
MPPPASFISAPDKIAVSGVNSKRLNIVMPESYAITSFVCCMVTQLRT